jgi:hypothetical protein
VCDEVAPPPGQRAEPAHKTHSPAEALRPTRDIAHRPLQSSLTATFTEHVQERFRHHNTNSPRPASTDGPTWCWSAPHDKSLFLYTPYRCAHVVVHAIHRRKGPIKDHRGARLTRKAATRCRSTMKLERPARPPPRHARFCHGAATCSCTIGLGLRRGRDLNLNLNLRVPLDSAYAEDAISISISISVYHWTRLTPNRRHVAVSPRSQPS